MAHIRKFNEPKLISSDIKIVDKCFGIIQDIFIDVSDDSNIKLDIKFLEFEGMSYSRFSRYGYTTIDINGEWDHEFLTYGVERGFFLISAIYDENESHNILNHLISCGNRCKELFDHDVKVDYSISNSINTIFIYLYLQESLV